MNNNRIYFPLFISLFNKKILIIGAGKIATRRVKVLLQFEPRITVIGEEISSELLEIQEKIVLYQREYKKQDLEDIDFVLVATNNANLNHMISIEARKKGILVNNASNQKDCDFFFPAILQDKDLIMGVCSSGKNPKKVKESMEKLREYWKE